MIGNVTDSTSTNLHRYLATTPKDRAWGCHVTAAGTHNVPPGQAGFTDPSGHQLWKKRRVIKDYGFIYVTRGKGVFKSEETDQMEIRAGDLFMLFPSVWHRYRPDHSTGWQEYWLLFNGSQMDRLLEHQMISPKSPVYHVGVGNKVEELFCEIMDSVQAQSTPPNRILAALTELILAHAVSSASDNGNGQTGPESDIATALAFLQQSVHEDVDMAALAASLSLSTCTFNRHFRKATGLTPHHYHTHLRMNRAKELLEDPDLRIKQISRKLGFQDQYYFSRVFKKHTGTSPVEWRKTMGRRTA